VGARRERGGGVARSMAEVAGFAALAVACGFALHAVPNVELITLTAFSSGVFLGVGRGALVGALSMLLFSTVNPLGPAALPILGAQVGAMAAAGVLGGLEGPWLSRRLGDLGRRSVVGLAALGVTGVVLTLFYDFSTNAAMAVLLADSHAAFWTLVLSGVAFSALHVVSNALVFTVMGGAAVRALVHWRRVGPGGG